MGGEACLTAEPTVLIFMLSEKQGAVMPCPETSLHSYPLCVQHHCLRTWPVEPDTSSLILGSVAFYVFDWEQMYESFSPWISHL